MENLSSHFFFASFLHFYSKIFHLFCTYLLCTYVNNEKDERWFHVFVQCVLEMEAKMDQLRGLVEAADREKVELMNQLEEEKRCSITKPILKEKGF